MTRKTSRHKVISHVVVDLRDPPDFKATLKMEQP